MRILVLVESRFGNTARIAEAVARGAMAGASSAAEVSVIAAGAPEAPALLAARPDLVLLGGPTEGRGTSRELARIVDGLEPSFRGLATATFDTRMRGSELIMGSAAKRLAQRLHRAGATLVAPKESFFVVRVAPPAGEPKGPQHVALEDGEEARAEAWGASLVRSGAAGHAG